MIVIMGGGIIRREKETHKIGEVHGQPMGFGGRDLNKISPGRGKRIVLLWWWLINLVLTEKKTL